MNKTHTEQQRPPFIEFVVIISFMMSITALTIDAILPALSQISTELSAQNPNDRQLAISILFLGLGLGQLFFGPLSDKTGRKPPVYIGYTMYIVGSLLAGLSATFPMLLTGRFLQGLGISGPRSVTLAIVRDRFEGRRMARVMSFVMTVFILVPLIAPSLGQVIMNTFGWRNIFTSLVVFALISLIWFTLRMPETLAPEHRAPFSFTRILNTTIEIVKIKPAIGYTVTSGLIGGAFLGYLNSSQQIFAEQYALGLRFPLIFSMLAGAIGLASLANSQLVMRFGMRFLVKWSLRIILGLAAVGFSLALMAEGLPPLWLLMTYLMLTFFCIGILFGNQNSLAMEPLGHLAGIGSAIVGSLATLIQTPLGILIGQKFDGTILPLIAGLAGTAAVSLLIVRWVEKKETAYN